MTVSGAKGGSVNFAQISALLGQQELEGRRVPRLPSGKTLPSFTPWDTAARAGGYIADRFLTGIRPQEYYFHCMAGREGLVDTAVKTSRSGYLQRCLVKNLECLRVAYDGTVRDCDGGCVQFCYGEDGLDVTKTGYARQFAFLAANAEAVEDGLSDWAALRGAPVLQPQSTAGFGPPTLPPMSRFHPACTVGAVGEAYRGALETFVRSNTEGLLRPEGVKKRAGDTRMAARDFTRLMELRHMRASVAPGEAVGVLAAQSVGEPSTQMTLNTFHFAGRGEANVTLGIPRLRELLMAAARRIGTPVMSLPTPGGEGAARALAAKLRRVTLAELLESFSVTETPFDGSHKKGVVRRYTVRATVRAEQDPQRLAAGAVGFPEAAAAFSQEFTRHLMLLLKAELRRAAADDALTIHSRRDAAAGPRVGAAQGEGDAGEDEPAQQRRRAEAEAEIGEAPAVAPEGGDEDEEGAKADERRSARAGEGYSLPDAEDGAAAGDDGDGEAAPPPPQDEEGDDVSDGENEEAVEAAGPKARPRAGAAPSSGRAGDAWLLTSLEDLRESCLEEPASNSLSVRLHLRLSAPKLLLLTLAQKAAARTEVRATKAVQRCHVIKDEQTALWRVQTDGVNFGAAYAAGADGALDCTRIGCNDVFAMLQHYGVEAARATLLAEVRAVFGAYGIAVDARHLSLIADAMTHTGAYRPCSRAGIDASPSPLLKMTFETATTFLTDATLRGCADPLASPSSRLVLGRLADVGTASCGLQYDLRRASVLNSERLAGAL